jgi:hypothetical protein
MKRIFKNVAFFIGFLLLIVLAGSLYLDFIDYIIKKQDAVVSFYIKG